MSDKPIDQERRRAMKLTLGGIMAILFETAYAGLLGGGRRRARRRGRRRGRRRARRRGGY
jgi:hypothetical protein